MTDVTQSPGKHSGAVAAETVVQDSSRRVVMRTKGRQHGPVTRLMSPGDIGGLTRPFVFLDYFDFAPEGDAMFPMHPHSGIATTTILLSGNMVYEDTTGASGVLEGGSIEWLNAGGGVWHDASPFDRTRFRGYQLWVALPPEMENSPPSSQYLPPEAVASVGPARVILGQYGGVRSPVHAPAGMACLHVRLEAGQRWRYVPPAGHTVAWAHVSAGAPRMAGTLVQNELVVFDESDCAIDIVAHDAAEFILASARKHDHDLVLGHYSVHTHAEALHQGESRIAQIGEQLRAQGRIR